MRTNLRARVTQVPDLYSVSLTSSESVKIGSAIVKRQVSRSWWERSNLLGVRCRWWKMFLIPLHSVFFFGSVLSPSPRRSWPRALVYSSGPMMMMMVAWSTWASHSRVWLWEAGRLLPPRHPRPDCSRWWTKASTCLSSNHQPSTTTDARQLHFSSSDTFSHKISQKHPLAEIRFPIKQSKLPSNWVSKSPRIGNFVFN